MKMLANEMLDLLIEKFNRYRFEVKDFSNKQSEKFSLCSWGFVALAGAVGFCAGMFFEFGNTPPKVAGFVVAALVAATVGLFVSESNKENEIGKLREKWLNELKQCCANYASGIEDVCDIVKKEVRKSNDISKDGRFYNLSSEFTKLVDEKIRSINKDFHVLVLYVATDDENKDEIQIYKLAKVLNFRLWKLQTTLQRYVANGNYVKVVLPQSLDSKAKEIIEVQVDEFVKKVKWYVDSEWKTIKRGHFSYKIKRMFFAAFLAFLAFLYFSYAMSYYGSIDRGSSDQEAVFISKCEVEDKGVSFLGVTRTAIR